MFGRVAIVGLYSKTSAATGVDKTTLHFVPLPFEWLLRIFFAFIATHEAFLCEQVLEINGHQYLPYLFSSNGTRWLDTRETAILQKRTKSEVHHPLGKAALRHILPGIAEHYVIGVRLHTVGNSVLHSQLGHDDTTGYRLYARTNNVHRELTNTFCHDTLDFCNAWSELWGFDSMVPSLDRALSRQNTFQTHGTWSIPESNISDAHVIKLMAEKLETLSELVRSLGSSGVPLGTTPQELVRPSPILTMTESVSQSVYEGVQYPVPSFGNLVLGSSSIRSLSQGGTISRKRSAENAFPEEVCIYKLF
jgi:hypothetical protein